MTSLLEKLIAVIAPHHCIGCSIENNILCESCALQLSEPSDSRCALCDRLTDHHAICAHCKQTAPLEHVWLAAEYDGIAAEVIKAFKFAGVRAAAEPLGRIVVRQLPRLSPETVIVPIPTVPRRVRQRGYDHALLLAKEVGKQLQLPVTPLLLRAHDARQVGAGRRQRLMQMSDAFMLKPTTLSRPILLVDDVVTTGATLSAAAKIVTQAGAVSVNAIVIAKRAASD